MIPKLLLRHGRLECREGKRLLNRRREREFQVEEQTYRGEDRRTDFLARGR